MGECKVTVTGRREWTSVQEAESATWAHMVPMVREKCPSIHFPGRNITPYPQGLTVALTLGRHDLVPESFICKNNNKNLVLKPLHLL